MFEACVPLVCPQDMYACSWLECGIECDAQEGQICVFPRTGVRVWQEKTSCAKAELSNTPPGF